MSSPHATNTSTADSTSHQVQLNPLQHDLHPPQDSHHRWIKDDLTSPHTTWTEDDENTLLKLQEEGKSWCDISNTLGRSRESCCAYYFKQASKPWTEKDDIELVELRGAKNPWAAIVAQTKRTKSSCYRRLQRLNDSPYSTNTNTAHHNPAETSHPPSPVTASSSQQRRAADNDAASSRSAAAQLKFGTWMSSSSITLPRDAPNVEQQRDEKVFDEDDLERMGHDAEATIKRNRTICDGAEDDQLAVVKTHDRLERIRLRYICG